ncbi:D-inositol-3-phosphate glycosyltransferase [compost metagenome]
MTASGLPIVASNVGGIREFVITRETGFLIEDHENIADYVAAIKDLQDINLRTTLNKGAQKLLANRFSRDTWHESLKNDIDR